MAPAAPRPWADPRLYVPIMVQTLALIVIGSQWKGGVDQILDELRRNIDRLESSQSSMSMLIAQHDQKIVRVETQLVAIERIEAKLDRAMRFMPLEQRGSAGAVGRLP